MFRPVLPIYFMTCGIYFIINLLDRKRYIGYSKRIERRYNNKFGNIGRDWTKHHNKLLANAARKYSIENFRFVIVEECLESELKEREIFYESMLPKSMLYNITPAGGRQDVEKFQRHLKTIDWKPIKKYVQWAKRKKQRREITPDVKQAIQLAWEQYTIEELSVEFKRTRDTIIKILNEFIMIDSTELEL